MIDWLIRPVPWRKATCEPAGAFGFLEVSDVALPVSPEPLVPVWAVNAQGEPVGAYWVDATPVEVLTTGLSKELSATTTGNVLRSAIKTLPERSTASPKAPLSPEETSVRIEPVQSSSLRALVAGSKKKTFPRPSLAIGPARAPAALPIVASVVLPASE